MRDHGASAIVPLNRSLMIVCMLLSLFLLPWWITLAVVVFVAALWRFASDQYGGMQISLLLLMGLFLGLGTIGRTLQRAEEEGRAVGVVEFLLETVVPVGLFLVSIIAFMVATVAVALVWEWIAGRWRQRNPQPPPVSDDSKDSLP